MKKRLQRAFGCLRAPWIRGSERAARKLLKLSDDLSQSREGLIRFSRSTEKEFASLAKGVGQLSSGLSAIRESAARLDGLVRNSGGEHALSSAYQLYKSARDLVISSLGFGEHAANELEQVDPILKECCSHQKGCSNIVTHFSILSIGFRIEAAKLRDEDQDVFAGVADQISKTQTKLGAMTEGAFGKLRSSLEHLVSDRQRIRTGQKRMEQDLINSTASIRSELDATSMALAPAGKVSEQIMNDAQAGQQLVCRIIEGLQVDDIVRQKLEHVSSNLMDLKDLLAGLSKGRRGKSGLMEDLAFVNLCARVQLEQIRSAKAEIEEAGEVVISGVRELLNVSGALLDALTDLQKRVADALENCSTAQLFAREIEKISEVAESCSQINQRISGLTDEISSIIDSFSRDILKHNFDIKVVALNAQVSASRALGGRTMESLAAETAQVAQTNEQLTGELLVSLNALPERLSCLQDEMKRFLDLAERDRSALSEEGEDVTRRLDGMDDTILDEAKAMLSGFTQLRKVTEGLLASVCFPKEVAKAFESAERVCLAVAEESAGFAKKCDSEKLRERLDVMKSGYTMKRELNAHESVLASGGEAVEVGVSELYMLNNYKGQSDTLQKMKVCADRVGSSHQSEACISAADDDGSIELF
ncbi:methyl-accepting chemotaxis protein [Pelagicoccus enzymogenes]|uniref:methyl-accepting chemotaxis protein n=1 Tax=Pelagicoccus enzymogenes TaxID=2773457 RepID=UPI00280DD794|nr:methyl-accepting chemotaxis protein [Pelagicoccus enzymogenes]MDQ8200262.1 methyl-accepting chemotaxis protein [Pelagicoccus enzymogenes]